MAFSVRIEVVKFPNDDDQPMLRLEVSWWEPQDLMRDDRFKYSNDTGSYADYTARLSSEEFRILHEKYRPAAAEPVWDCSMTRAKLSILDAIPDLLNHRHDVIIVTAFEWESGY